MQALRPADGDTERPDLRGWVRAPQSKRTSPRRGQREYARLPSIPITGVILAKFLEQVRKRHIEITLGVLSAAAAVGMIAFSGEEVFRPLQGTRFEPLLHAMAVPNTIGFNLCIGFLTSVFFWWLVVYRPDVQRRRLLRASLKSRYIAFKHNTIQQVVWCCGMSLNTDEIDELCNQKRFQQEFHGRWDDVANALQEEPDRLRDILLELELLSLEMQYVLNNLAVQDAQLHGMFKRLSEHVYRLRNDDTFTSEQVKYVCQFLWTILAGWSFIDGYREDDVVERTLERI